MKNISISVILSLALAGLAALSAVMIMFAVQHHIENAIKRDAGFALQEFAKEATQQLDQEIYRYLQGLHAYAHIDELDMAHLDIASQRHKLESLKSIQPAYGWLGIINAQGVVRVATGGELEGFDLSHEAVFKSGLQNPYVSAARTLANEAGEKSEYLELELATPVHVEHEPATGVIATRLNWAWSRQVVDSLLDPARRERQVDVFILDSRGQNILSPPGVPAGQPMQKSDTPHLVDWSDGQRYLTVAVKSRGYRDYQGLGWTVYVRQPAAVALFALNEVRKWIFAIGCFVICFSALVGWWLARRISRPLLDLTRAAELLCKGDAASLPEARGYREAHVLSRSFSHLLSLLAEERKNLFRLNASLEEQVTVRTRLLEEANEHLVNTLAERHTLISQLETLAHTDSLTGLANRRAFFERAGLEMARQERQQTHLALLTMDIDFFKKINDQFGHEGGDLALKAFAKAGQRLLRDVDLLARLGGEEFVVLLPETDLSGALLVAERLRSTLAKVAVPLQEGEIHFTVSIGLALHVPDENLKTWMARADAALYYAKGHGRNRVQVWSENLGS